MQTFPFGLSQSLTFSGMIDSGFGLAKSLTPSGQPLAVPIAMQSVERHVRSAGRTTRKKKGLHRCRPFFSLRVVRPA